MISKTVGYNGVHDIFRHTQNLQCPKLNPRSSPTDWLIGIQQIIIPLIDPFNTTPAGPPSINHHFEDKSCIRIISPCHKHQPKGLYINGLVFQENRTWKTVWCWAPTWKTIWFSDNTLWLCQNSYWKWPLISWDIPLNMIIFHCYVSLPEGKPPFSYGFPMVFPLKKQFFGTFSGHGLTKAEKWRNLPEVPWRCDGIWILQACIHGLLTCGELTVV